MIEVFDSVINFKYDLSSIKIESLAGVVSVFETEINIVFDKTLKLIIFLSFLILLVAIKVTLLF